MPLNDGDTTGHAGLDTFLDAFVAWVESDSAVRPRPVQTPKLRAAALAAYKDLRNVDGWAEIVNDIEIGLPVSSGVAAMPLPFLAACAVAWASEIGSDDRFGSAHAASHFLTCFYTVAIGHCPSIRASWG